VQQFNDGRVTPPPVTPPPSTGFNSVFSEIQANIFTPSCATSGCHCDGNQAAGLSLASADTSFLKLVGQFSNQNGQANVMLVAPTDSDGSYIIRKMEGAAGITGSRMPVGAVAIPQSDIDQIRLWITNGALRQ
jgi:hypothetical protein